MTELNGSTLRKPDPGEPSIAVGTMLRAARPGPQEPLGTRAGRPSRTGGKKATGTAAREVPGIHALGGGFNSHYGHGERPGPGQASAGRGVKAKVGEKQTAIGLQVVVKTARPARAPSQLRVPGAKSGTSVGKAAPCAAGTALSGRRSSRGAR